MTDYVLHIRGLRGVETQILRNRDKREPLNEFERGRKIGDPIRIEEGKEHLATSPELARQWFPPPATE